MKKAALLSYCFLSLPLSFIGIPIYIYLPKYYNQSFDISLATTGAILLFTRLFDTVQDPLFGMMSDRLPRFKKHMIAFGSVALGLSLFALFRPDIAPSYQILYIIIATILTYSFYSLVVINYQSYLVNLTTKYHYKTFITGSREIFTLIGLLLAAIIPNVLNNLYGWQQSFAYVTWGFMVVIIIAALLIYFYLPEINIKPRQVKIKTSILKTIWQRKTGLRA